MDIDRRRFLQRLGALAAMAGATTAEARATADSASRFPWDATSIVAAGPRSAHNSSPLLPSLNFETFVPGKGNEIALGAAMQVAKRSGSHKPLHICAGTGLGKTHLCHAIGNHILCNEPTARVRFIYAEAFVADLIRAYRDRSVERFRSGYRSLDVLLIDDISFLLEKPKMQNEFFRLSNALLGLGKQIVIAGDALPAPHWESGEGVPCPFGDGINVTLGRPDFDLRVGVLLATARVIGITLHDDVTRYIATRIRSDVRELQAAFRRVLAYASVHGRQVSIPVAQDALRGLPAEQPVPQADSDPRSLHGHERRSETCRP